MITPPSPPKLAITLLWAILTTPLITTISLETFEPALAHADDMAEAQKLYRSGEKLYKDGDFEAAARDFTRAYELSEKPELLYYIARSWEEVGELGKAQDSYQRYIDELPDAKNADEVIDKIIEIQERIATEMGRVSVSTPTDGAKVFVDGEDKSRCETPCMLILKPGAYSIKVEAAEGTQTRDVSLDAGSREEFAVEFNVVKTGTLLISTDAANTRVKVSGKEAQLPLRAPIELEEGKHSVTVTDGADKTWTGQVTIVDGEQTSLIVPLAHAGDSKGGGDVNIKRVGAYSLASAGVGLLLGGVFMGLQTRSTFNNLEASRQAGRQIDKAMIDQGKSQQRVSNVLFLTGGLAIAGGGGLFAWDYFGGDSKKKKAAPSEGSEDNLEGFDDDSSSSDVDLLE